MTDEEKKLRLEALQILNKHFRFQPKAALLEDYQVRLVLNAMIEFQQYPPIQLKNLKNPE